MRVQPRAYKNFVVTLLAWALTSSLPSISYAIVSMESVHLGEPPEGLS